MPWTYAGCRTHRNSPHSLGRRKEALLEPLLLQELLSLEELERKLLEEEHLDLVVLLWELLGFRDLQLFHV